MFQIKDRNLARAAVNRPKVDAGDQQQCVTLVKLRELRVLPIELLHVVAVSLCYGMLRVPHLQLWRESVKSRVHTGGFCFFKIDCVAK